MKAKRLLYLLYYLRELNWPTFFRFTHAVTRETGMGKWTIWWNCIRHSLQYNISLLEYFQFRFYRLTEQEKATYAGTGFMYEYQRRMNPPGARMILADKHLFLREYAPFVGHAHRSLEELQRDPQSAAVLLGNSSGRVVLKNSHGQCGVGVEVMEASGMGVEQLVRRLIQGENDLAEEFVVQHEALQRLSPSGLNTVRVITQLNRDNEVDFLGARLRITVNSAVDNLAAGNLAAPINLETGTVEGPGVYSDITREDQAQHPVTGVSIVGFQVPDWERIRTLARKAALHNTSNRSIGWDIAVTERGPFLIEGNHDWCKLLWQLPVKRGLKPVLEQYT